MQLPASVLCGFGGPSLREWCAVVYSTKEEKVDLCDKRPFFSLSPLSLIHSLRPLSKVFSIKVRVLANRNILACILGFTALLLSGLHQERIDISEVTLFDKLSSVVSVKTAE